MRFARKNLYGLDLFDEDHGEMVETILTISDWWDDDGSLSSHGSWFLVFADDLLYLTDEGVEYLENL